LRREKGTIIKDPYSAVQNMVAQVTTDDQLVASSIPAVKNRLN
jgi:hypothetical protein